MSRKKGLTQRQLLVCGKKLFEYLRGKSKAYPAHTLNEWIGILDARNLGFQDLTDFLTRFLDTYVEYTNRNMVENGHQDVILDYELIETDDAARIRIFLKTASHLITNISVKFLEAITQSPERALTLSVPEWLDVFGLDQSDINTCEACVEGLVRPLVDYLNTREMKFSRYEFTLVQEDGAQKIKIGLATNWTDVNDSCIKLLQYLYEQPDHTETLTLSEWAAKLGLSEQESQFVTAFVTDINKRAKGIAVHSTEISMGELTCFRLQMVSTDDNVVTETLH